MKPKFFAICIDACITTANTGGMLRKHTFANNRSPNRRTNPRTYHAAYRNQRANQGAPDRSAAYANIKAAPADCHTSGRPACRQLYLL